MNEGEPGISIRGADPTRDLTAVIALNRHVQDLHAAAEPAVFRGSDDLPGAQEFYRGFMENEDRFTYVAEVGGDLVGYVCLELVRGPGHTFTHARDRLYVHQLGVHPLHRRQGVGRALMSQVETFAEEVGVSEIGLDTWSFNADALRFFEALGFTAYNIRLWKTAR